jgi:hypothetical protein
MRNAILVAASIVGIASPSIAIAADMPLPRYGEVPTYQRQVERYEYREPPPVVIEREVIVRRPVVVERPRVMVEEYPVYEDEVVYVEPRVYGGPVYAHAGPGWRRHWGHRHSRGRW